MTNQNKYFFSGLFFGILIAGGVSFLFLNKLSKVQKQNQQLQIVRQSELTEAERISGLVNLMGQILERADQELEKDSNRTLSDETIGKISALSYSFISHNSSQEDSVSQKRLSPERGQLLLMLTKMKIDSASFSKIMLQTDFSGAVLRDADLRGADLAGANLNGADLQDANLEGATLAEAKMRSANLWGANLRNSKLMKAFLRTADMRWANLNRTDFSEADLQGADMSSAQMRQADLHEADLKWAELSGAIMHEAVLAGTNLTSTNLKRAQLENATLIEANLTSSHLNEANLTGSNLSGANLTLTNMAGANLSGVEMEGVMVTDKNWITRLDEWKVTGADEIQSRYKMVDESVKNQVKFRLEKNGG